MKSKFALSFGISLIIVGFLNIIWPVSSVVLLGFSVSSFVFSLINIFLIDNSGQWNLLYILSFSILLFFCCCGNSLTNYDIVKSLINSDINSLLTFISFGFLFISEYINHKKELKINKSSEIDFINNNIDFIDEIIDSLNRFGLDKKQNDINSQVFLKSIVDKCKDEIANMRVRTRLLALNKDDFSTYDVIKALSNNKNE